MTSDTAHPLKLTQPAKPGVLGALQGLAVASQRLVTALWAAALHHPKAAVATLSAYQEAEAMREMAHAYLAKDPNFAQDLYVAADCHELKDRS